MRIRYFIADRDDTIHRVSARLAQGIWNGDRSASELPFAVDDELALITVLVDDNLQPQVCFLLRFPLTDGVTTERSHLTAFEAMEEVKHQRFEHPAAQHQLQGWPANWRQQLAVALDVPMRDVRRIGVGGPLPLSDLLGVPIPSLLRYFDDAFGE